MELCNVKAKKNVDLHRGKQWGYGRGKSITYLYVCQNLWTRRSIKSFPLLLIAFGSLDYFRSLTRALSPSLTFSPCLFLRSFSKLNSIFGRSIRFMTYVCLALSLSDSLCRHSNRLLSQPCLHTLIASGVEWSSSAGQGDRKCSGRLKIAFRCWLHLQLQLCAPKAHAHPELTRAACLARDPDHSHGHNQANLIICYALHTISPAKPQAGRQEGSSKATGRDRSSCMLTPTLDVAPCKEQHTK